MPSSVTPTWCGRWRADQQIALAVNPYHLGFSLWDKLIERDGLEAARRIMQEDDDFGFVRNHLTREMADELGLFRFAARGDGQIKVMDHDLHGLHEALLAPKYNFGAPNIAVSQLRNDGSLELEHDHVTDGRGIDVDRGRKVLEYIRRVWAPAGDAAHHRSGRCGAGPRIAVGGRTPRGLHVATLQ